MVTKKKLPKELTKGWSEEQYDMFEKVFTFIHKEYQFLKGKDFEHLSEFDRIDALAFNTALTAGSFMGGVTYVNEQE